MPGGPAAQPRHRASVVAGHVHTYEADGRHGIHLWKAAVRFAGQRMMDSRPLVTEPVRLALVWVFQRPKRLMSVPRPLLYEGPKDIDNLEKAVMDALNQVVWIDDRQVSCVIKQAVWGGPADAPGLHFWAWRDRLLAMTAALLAPITSLPSTPTRRAARGRPRSGTSRRRLPTGPQQEQGGS